MGYDLHITRREHWAETEVADISFDEWINYVNSDNELELTNGYDLKIGSETHFQNNPGFCEWNSHPTEKEPNRRPWFAYWEGSIDTKNPDEPTIQKMLKIASALDAKVQGDDGEIYTDEYLMEISENNKRTTKQYEIKPWWKFW